MVAEAGAETTTPEAEAEMVLQELPQEGEETLQDALVLAVKPVGMQRYLA